jgi:hypothetical protein
VVQYMWGTKLITDSGKQLVAKYLLGQAPAYATYLAAGVGSKALSQEETILIPPNKDSLDFEVFRVPITSKGFIKEDGVEKIVFKAEMPSEQRYQITELGIYPAASNSVAGKYDSKLLVTFSPTEQWQYVLNGSASAVPYPNEAIDSDSANDINNDIEDVLFINSDSTIFNGQDRKNRNEGPRFLNTSLMINGSASFLSETFIPTVNSISLENSNINFDLGQNLPDDKLKIALSLVSKTGVTNANPDAVRIKVEFINNLSGVAIAAPKATLKILLTDADFTDEFDNVKRYIIVEKTLSQFVKDDNFSWSNVNYIRIYATVIVSNNPSDNYYIVFDGMRLDNLTSENPLYSLFAYNLLKTDDGYPILKQENTTNYIEYRFGIGVDG